MKEATKKPDDTTDNAEQIVQVPLVDLVTGDWQKWRKVVEDNMATASVEQKSHYNAWDHMADVIAVLKKMQSGEWKWYRNSRCKYVEVRIDMRSGHCIIRDQDGQRINPSDLSHQVT